MAYQSNRMRLQQRLVEGAAEGLTEADLRIQTAAQAELYPGHGVRSGTLRRSISGEPGRVISLIRAEGRVTTRGVPYARIINLRYRYMENGYAKVKSRIKTIVAERMKRRLGQ